MSALLALIRHGPTAWNLAGRIQGRADVPLSPDGRRTIAALQLPQCLRRAEWRTSPLSRAIATAEALGIDDARVDERLTEMDWGAWEGETLAALRRRHGADMRRNEARGLDFTPPGGESPRCVQARLRPLLAELAAGPPVTAAVTHKGVIRALLAAACDWNMTGKPPARLDWSAAQVFRIEADAAIRPHRLNLALAAPCR